jgi:hydrogenase maturation protease
MLESRHPLLSETDPRVVVIGYGNPKRGDDALSQAVVSQIQALSLPKVQACAVTRLTPELASKLAAADCAIFVDACKLASADVSVKPITACGSEPSGSVVPASGHSCDPCSLLALASSAYGHCPQAWWVEVPASDFTAGNALSAVAEQGVTQAVQKIEALISKTAQIPTPLILNRRNWSLIRLLPLLGLLPEKPWRSVLPRQRSPPQSRKSRIGAWTRVIIHRSIYFPRDAKGSISPDSGWTYYRGLGYPVYLYFVSSELLTGYGTAKLRDI